MGARESRDFKFDKRASSYDEGFEGRASRRFYGLLLREVQLSPGMAVLDVGCGTGALLRKLSDVDSIEGVGIDVEEQMLSEARRKCPHMEFALARCDEMPFEAQRFDVVIACMAYHHFDDKAGFAREAARILKPGGVLYIADPRFPWLVRKTLNGVLRLMRMVGEFFTADEIASALGGFGFSLSGCAYDRYAQVVRLRKLPDAPSEMVES